MNKLKRKALVVGVNEYTSFPLRNAIHDAKRVKKTLESRGFDVSILENATLEDLRKNINIIDSKNEDIYLIYLAGHGVERYGSGYFLPSDFSFPVSSGNLQYCAVSINEFVESIRSAKQTILVLDICRNWPGDEEQSMSLNRNIDELSKEQNTWSNVLISYSTSSGNTAYDGIEGDGTLFCSAFCEQVLLHNLSFEDAFRNVCSRVIEKSDRKQIPWMYSNLTESGTFSDLPIFSLNQRHILPKTNMGLSTWSIPNIDKTGIYVGRDCPRIWEVQMPEWALTYSKNDNDLELVGIADFGVNKFISDSNGNIYERDEKIYGRKNTGEATRAFGLRVSPKKTSFTQFGDNFISIFTVKHGKILKVKTIYLEISVYGCEYIDDFSVVVAGYGRKISIVNINKYCSLKQFLYKKIRNNTFSNVGIFKKLHSFFENSLNSHIKNIETKLHVINAISLSKDKKKLYIAGNKIYEIDLEFKNEDRKILDSMYPETPEGLRSKLRETVLPDALHEYTFNRNLMNQSIRTEIDSVLSYMNFTSCAVAKDMPIIAVGTQESTVVLVDIRDRQIISKIDVTCGYSGSINGIDFLSDDVIVSANCDGSVAFITSNRSWVNRSQFKSLELLGRI